MRKLIGKSTSVQNEPVSNEAERVAPHCDPMILHAPGKCQFCALNPDWQQYRQIANINFTGESDPDKAPCPSLFFRTSEIRDRWPGNRPEGYTQ